MIPSRLALLPRLAVLLAALAGPACSDDPCKPGTSRCACESGTTCEAGLQCMAGKCTPVAMCEPGIEGCPCNVTMGCAQGLTCNASRICQKVACLPGKVGCFCDAGKCTDPGVSCDKSNVCQRATCTAGNEGCDCAAGGRCGASSSGKQLACVEGLCADSECLPGVTGCACKRGSECADATSSCQAGYCIPIDCVAGALNCPCSAGSCSPGLMCRDGVVCVDGRGLLGGGCKASGLCSPGLRCSAGVCVPCALGTLGCACEGMSCVSALKCAAGQCVEPTSVPPTTPTCYTPCERGLTLPDGTYRACPADKLMQGCLTGLECREGTCLNLAVPVPTCNGDQDCPAHQACMRNNPGDPSGKCFSNCAGTADCAAAGKDCYLRVCRVPCQANMSACGQGEHCLTVDGDNGFCMPTRDTGPKMPMPPSTGGAFSLSATTLGLSNIKPGDTVKLVNNADGRKMFRIRKLEESVRKADGTTTTLLDLDDGKACDPTKDCPLVWLEMAAGAAAPSKASEIMVSLDGKADTTLTFGKAGDGPGVGWQGTVEVINDELGTQRITMLYSPKPEGQWQGTAYYYSTFGNGGVPAWIAADDTAKRGTALQSDLGNALLQRWAAFRTSKISWEEFQATLASTQSGSWKWASTAAACTKTTAKACYPFDNNVLGVREYSSDLILVPVPSGVTELPIALNLYQPNAAAPDQLAGRVESTRTLHYAGNPQVTLALAKDPATYASLGFGGAWLNYVKSFSFTAYVGGRYTPELTDANCTARPGFSLVKTPWMLPGLLKDTNFDSATSRLYRHECRDTVVPFTGPKLEPLNPVFARSNPVPDGLMRKRDISLIDGAMINQSVLFLIFEEKFDSFLDPADPNEALKAYGYMVLRRTPTLLETADKDGNGKPDGFQGSNPPPTRPVPTPPPASPLAVSCTREILDQTLGVGIPLDSPGRAAKVTRVLVEGADGSGPGAVIDAASTEEVHYLCEETGLFDGGAGNTTSHYTPTAPIPPNDNSCAGTNDIAGWCDDGGPNSNRGTCPLGTDLTDCGVREADDRDIRVACPETSKVIFFTVDETRMTQDQIAKLPCQTTKDPTNPTHLGSCATQLADWRKGGGLLRQYEPAFKCASGALYCDKSRFDLRDNKIFYSAASASPFPALRAEIDSAFRYKTRFRNRQGTGLAFAPEICIPDSDQIPYCYDPTEIEEIRDRVDCLLHIWNTYYPQLRAPTAPATDIQAANLLDSYLKHDFSYDEECRDPPACNIKLVHDGFERLFAELLVMMGDESYTAAFASRFDLAGSNIASFEGTAFEPGGIDLSGAAGHEMHSLYKAVQYYDEALGRFYELSPLVWLAITDEAKARKEVEGTPNPPRVWHQNFVTQQTVTSYLERLIRASTQKARALSEISKKYQGFNKPDLARRVIERAYTATYLEGVVISRIMLRITDALAPEKRPQILNLLAETQLRYRMAMLDMQKEYNAISDQTLSFGFPPDYIPFPALDVNQSNAFELIAQRAWSRVNLAKAREDQALASNRAYETDAAQFQAELVRLRTTYENQLADVCGTFAASDGRVYPAIERYAELHPRSRALGDPCGLMGNGGIHAALGAVDLAQLDLSRQLIEADGVFSSIAIEQDRVRKSCALTTEIADFVYKQAGRNISLQEDIKELRRAQGIVQAEIAVGKTLAAAVNCEPPTAGTAVSVGTCPGAIAAASLTSVFIIEEAVISNLLQQDIDQAEIDIANIDRSTAKWQMLKQCDQAKIDSDARTAEMLLRLKQIKLEMLRGRYQLQLAMSEVQKLRNQATRFALEQEEAGQLAINVEAAKNDPNIRIYRNDAILNADIAFEDAVQQVYRATRVYEYYTSQSYIERDKLYLVRMVSAGDYNLENYLVQLENAFNEFEETFGNPDTRVAILSMRDDILHIPRLDEAGQALTQAERIDRMRVMLADPTNIDRDGYLNLGFGTDVDDLSPLTRNHKILHMEAEMIGSDIGDTVGRVYLRQSGTGVVRAVDDSRSYYRFPERTAVLNPFFNGNRIFVPEVYKNFRMRDRPFANTSWSLVLNLKDEAVNQDINLQSLTDIRVYLYYTDFTEL